MKKFILLVLTIITTLYIFKNKEYEENIIPDNAIRFRVIASSNTVYDQNVKLQVRNTVQNKLFELLNGVESIEETRIIINDNISELEDLTKQTLVNTGNDIDFTINYGYNHFPKKKYKGIVYKEGNYESLVIKLGEGSGDNWWCVLFPPLCLVEADESDVSNTEYTFFIKELIKKYIK